MTMRRGNPSTMDAAIGNQDFADEQRGLLELIDKLQFAQLNTVKLPQIVVVGDQSAGKSSVLEAITQLAFPREAGACTRFATEIRLRRAAEEGFSIRIIPDQDRNYAEQERLKQFGTQLDESMSFEALMRLAVDQIAPKKIPGRFASKDILVVEKRGPTMPLLTVVDLPGLVKNPNNDQSIDDIRAINSLTDRYMKSSRTIILAVVGGNQDYVQAPVLTKARTFDPKGVRTLGVLTKPDLTRDIGLEDKFIALVNNKDDHNRFDLGWFVLLNPGPREPGQEWPSTEERKEVEDAFFLTGKWSILPPTMCGAAALKQRLSEQLQRHIGKHVKTLQKEIRKEHNDCMAQLKLLGNGKDTVEEMREEIGQLHSDSKELVVPAVDGTYKNPLGRSFFPRDLDKRGIPAQKLRARVVEENKRFAERVRMYGQKFELSSGSGFRSADGTRVANGPKQQHAREVVEPFIRQNKGVEFPGDHNPGLVYLLFQSHSQKWSRLAQEHKDNIGVICNEFLGEVVDEIWPNRMREPLRRHFLDLQMKEVMQKAQNEVEELTKDLQLEIAPYDPEYETRMTDWRSQGSNEAPYTEAEELLEKMLIFYELTAKTFITNVITQVVERHLLQGLRGVFNWLKLNKMKDETVIAIAAENKATRDKRVALKAKKIAIEDALDTCTALAMRKELRTYDDDTDDSDASSSDEKHRSSPTRERQPKSPKTTRASRSSTSTPMKAQQQSNDVHPQRTPNRSETTSHSYNSNINGHSYETAEVENDNAASFTNGEPQYAPPPPPRPPKVNGLDNKESQSPQTPRDATSFPMPGTLPNQPSRSESNSHQYSQSSSRLDLNMDPGYASFYHPQNQAGNKTRRGGLFGLKA